MLSAETPFVGREDALAFLQGIGPTHPPTVVVTGAEGIGKTRLVQHHLGYATDAHGGRVLWCKMEDALRTEEALHRITSTLDLQLARSSDDDSVAIIGELLSKLCPLSLVLDHVDPLVVAEVLQWADRWTSQEARLRVLVTAREVLVPQDRIVHLPLRPLRLPPRTSGGATDVLRAEAAQLFVARAQRAVPRWQ
ncbi:MAG: AAA family ATPase, partial [Myxococcota bacterium]